LSAPGPDWTENASIFTVSCIAENDIAAESVTAENFSAVDTQGRTVHVTDAYYYPASKEIRLTLLADEEEVNKSFEISASALKDTEGNPVEFSAEAAAFREAAAEYNTVAAVGYIFSKDGKNIDKISGKTGIVTTVKIINATGNPACGTVILYDGEALCAEAQFSINGDGVGYVEVDSSAHCFSKIENLSCRFVLN